MADGESMNANIGRTAAIFFTLIPTMLGRRLGYVAADVEKR
jgi:hypothetical protein